LWRSIAKAPGARTIVRSGGAAAVASSKARQATAFMRRLPDDFGFATRLF
jgi:hypothetical protein